MKPGKMDTLATLYAVDDARTASGEAVASRSKVARVFAEVIPQRGRRVDGEAVAKTSKRTAQFRIRWQSAFAALGAESRHEIEVDGIRWRILSATTEGRRAGMLLDCETVNAAAR